MVVKTLCNNISNYLVGSVMFSLLVQVNPSEKIDLLTQLAF